MEFAEATVIRGQQGIGYNDSLADQVTEGTGNGSGNDVTTESVRSDFVSHVDSRVMRLVTAIGQND